jgi:hypothetical protein
MKDPSYVGYSTDIKPNPMVPKGVLASYLELDTKIVFIWDGTKWVQI